MNGSHVNYLIIFVSGFWDRKSGENSRKREGGGRQQEEGQEGGEVDDGPVIQQQD